VLVPVPDVGAKHGKVDQKAGGDRQGMGFLICTDNGPD
jgi:hypothetical protein